MAVAVAEAVAMDVGGGEAVGDVVGVGKVAAVGKVVIIDNSHRSG